MKKIAAIIRTNRLDEVKTALVQAGVLGMTISEVRGLGQQKSVTETYRGVKRTIDFWSKFRVEVIVAEEQVDQVIESLVKSAQTGEIGDGKIFLSPVDSVVRIRTQEINLEAL